MAIDLSTLQGKDYLTLAVSTIALFVALYGILERGRAARDARRIRLTEVLNDLVEVSLEQTKEASSEEASHAYRLSTGYNARREVLSAIAIALIKRGVPRVTGREYVVLASALQRSGDWHRAERYWKRAVHGAKRKGAYGVFALRGFAGFKFLLGDLASGRAHFKKALKLELPHPDNRAAVDAETYATWALSGWNAGGRFSDVNDLFDHAEARSLAIQHKEMRAYYLAMLAHRRSAVTDVESPTS